MSALGLSHPGGANRWRNLEVTNPVVWLVLVTIINSEVPGSKAYELP